MANVFGSQRGKHKIDIAPVVVIGLGRFGSSLSRELVDHGVEVLGVDADEKLVRAQAPHLTEAVIADATDADALTQLGIEEVERVVLAIGTHIEDSILAASNLVEAGVKDIWAKADSDPHARILTQIGVHHIVRPERDTGRRIAHLLGGKFQDFAELAENYGVTKLTAPGCVVGHPVDIGKLLRNRGIQLVSVRSGIGQWRPIQDGDVLSSSDLIVAAGSPENLEAFSGSK